MKIAYLANIRFPSERAHSVQIAHMCKAFSEVGADVTLFVNKRSKASVEEAEMFLGFKVPFRIKRISHGIFAPRIKIAHHLSELFFAINFLLGQKHKSFDVIYSRHEWVVWLLSHFINSRRLIWESHEAKLNLPARRLLRKGIKVVAISEGICEDYEVFGVVKEQLLVAHDGIDDSFFGEVEDKAVVRKRLGLAQDGKVVMYIGGFDTWKGVETFFAAAELVPEVLFVAIGGSEKQIEQFSKQYPLVRFLGAMPYADLKHNQQAADVLVVPNSSKELVSVKYTSPLKLFAHMASGVPLMVSNIPSLTVVVSDSEAARFESDNTASFVAELKKIFAEYSAAQDKALILKKRSLVYTWKKRAEHILSFITS